jgi:hypothetical protein
LTGRNNCRQCEEIVDAGQRERFPLSRHSRMWAPRFRAEARSPRVRAERRLSNAPSASPEHEVERSTGFLLGRSVRLMRLLGQSGRSGGPALSRLKLAVHGFIASQSCGEPVSDFTFGRLRLVLMERVGAARRFRRSRAAIRALRGASNPGFCPKAL